MAEHRITRAKIVKDRNAFLGGRASVNVTYEGGATEPLFGFYTDELSFTEQEFVGKTRDQALRLHFDRDLAYLRL